MKRIANLLSQIYGESEGARALDRLQPVMAKYDGLNRTQGVTLDQKDVVLITYGDSVRQLGHPPLETLRAFARRYLRDVVSTIHFLPFFPYSSDDGFSVVDYLRIDPDLGDWMDVEAFLPDFRIMVDYVVNHVSAKSAWFEAYLSDERGYEGLAIEVNPSDDLSMVVRPRSLPLLTPFRKRDGRRVHVWTTFSEDQIDLNFNSIDVLIAMIDVMLAYVQHGASILRLDAIAYLWKEIGTPCIHLPQTHLMVKLFRAILDALAPHVLIITETNVPHEENIRYFGENGDEAQLVYNFSLPPMILFAFLNGDTSLLSSWVRTLDFPEKRTTLFNFTASHDGIGVRPLEGLVPAEKLDELMRIVNLNGGRVSYKRDTDGTESPYELNITYVDALKEVGSGGDEMHARRFLAAQSIALVLPGVPAVYIHSLLGSRNWEDGVRLTGRARTINREKLDMETLVAELENPETFRSRVFTPYKRMIQVRREQPAFHPKAGFEVLTVSSKVFAIVRFDGRRRVVAATNIVSDYVTIELAGEVAGPAFDLLTGRQFSSGGVTLAPYEVLWLTTA